MESGFYPSIMDTVKVVNTIIQAQDNHSESCITGKVSRRTQKVETYFANEGSAPSFFSTDVGHIFGSNVGSEFGAMFRRR